MPATVSTGAAPDIRPGDGTFASSPLILLVFGFVLLVLLQAWFVRRIAQLTTRHKERKDTHGKLRAQAAELGEEVASLDRAGESGATSITGLERETQELQERIDAFVAEHEGPTPTTTTSTSTPEDGDDKRSENTESPTECGDS